MSENVSILAAIRPMNYQGRNEHHDQWPKVIAALQTMLQQNGFEDEDSSADLLLFTFNHPYSAITTIFSSLEKINEDFNIKDEQKILPIQFIVHLIQPDDINPAVSNPDADIWEMLQPGTIYITRPLKSNWDLLMAKKDLPNCVLKNDSHGLAKLQITAQETIRKETLLAFRTLPSEGRQKECFYCGMKSHEPASCPSKHLDMTSSGLQEAGYLPFKQLNMIYKKVFSAPEKTISTIAAGVSPNQIRKSDDLKVFIAYMDINRIYQPRFLLNMTFCIFTKWESLFNQDKIKVDNKNMQLGLDCLRVGQYGKAEELLLMECQHKSPKRFYATAGLALLSLEIGRSADMRTHLEMLNNIALQEKERLYAALMLSRYYELADENWKARDVIKNTSSIKIDCQETLYRKIQLEVKGNFTEAAFQQLRSMMSDDRSLYMTVLMDPSLSPIHAKAEDILSTQYHTQQHNAKENFAQAQHEVNALKLWFKDNDSKMKVNLTTLANLQKKLDRGSYFDLLDVEHKSKALHAASRHLRESKLNELYEQIAKAMTQWSGYYQFWRTYQFPYLFKNFHSKLIPIKKYIDQAKILAKKDRGETYRQSVSLLKKAQKNIRKLKPIFRRMEIASILCSSGVSFSKFLIITEIAVAIVASLIAVALGTLPADSPLSGLAQLAENRIFQKKAMMFASFIVSPIIALSLTFAKKNNT